jgi:hypothetical protein
VEKLKAIPQYEFENWAVIALGGIPNKVQVGDMGIDGRIYPVGTKPTEAASKGKKGETDHTFADDWFPIQVKQMDKVGRWDNRRLRSRHGARRRRRPAARLLRQRRIRGHCDIPEYRKQCPFIANRHDAFPLQ